MAQESRDSDMIHSLGCLLMDPVVGLLCATAAMYCSYYWLLDADDSAVGQLA